MTTCCFCGHAIHVQERWTIYHGATCHVDCLTDHEMDRLEEAERERG